MIANQQDFLRPLIREILLRVMEVENGGGAWAEKGERASNRIGYVVGYYTRTLVTAGRKTGGAGAAGSVRAVPAENFDRYQRGQRRRSVH